MGALKIEQGKKSLKVNQQTLYKLRSKYQRANVTDASGLIGALNTTLDAIIEQDATPRQQDLEIMSDMLDMVMENIEREEEERAARERTAEEWRRLEYEYQRVGEFYYSMFTIERIKEPEIAAKYRECAHMFCLNAFKPARKNQNYCSEGCRKAEHAAQKEFKRTSKIYANGTYLPVSAYLSNRTKTEQEKYEKHELLFDAETLQLIHQAENNDEVEPTANAERRERRMRSTRIDKEIKTAKHGEVITYKLSEMTMEEIGETFKGTKINGLNPSFFSR